MAACTECQGRFVPEDIFVSLANDMQPPGSPLLTVLPLWSRVDSPLACPSCKQAMQPVHLGEVLLDHCARHGLWFDGGEMAESLLQFSEPASSPAMRSPGWSGTRAVVPVHSRAARHEPWLVLAVLDPAREQPVRCAFAQPKVLVGSAAHATLRIEGAAECEAILYRLEREPPLLLAESDQVLVNGARARRHALALGDRLQIAGLTMHVVHLASA